jgi:hypothetical protein
VAGGAAGLVDLPARMQLSRGLARGRIQGHNQRTGQKREGSPLHMNQV